MKEENQCGQGERRIGSQGAWRKLRECFVADGYRVVIAQLEGGMDQTDFGTTEWLNMPLADSEKCNVCASGGEIQNGRCLVCDSTEISDLSGSNT